MREGARWFASSRKSSPGDAEVLRLEVLLDARAGSLAADPALLHTSERRGRVRDEAAVDADHAGVDRLAEPQRLGELAEDVRRQPVLGVVDASEELVDVVPDHDRRDGAEDLLTQQRVAGLDAGEHDRRVEVTGAGGDR